MFNFKKRTFRVCISMMFSVAILVSSSVHAAVMPYGTQNSDYFREKALENFFAEKTYLLSLLEPAESNYGISDSVVAMVNVSEVVDYSEASIPEEIPYNTVKRLNKNLGEGETVTVREGVPGKKIKCFQIKYVNGEEVSRELLSEYVEVAPVDKIVEYGDKSEPVANTSGGNFEYKYVIECTATAYDLSPEENGGYGGMSATGVPLDKGVIAVDPRVIPLGSRVYIEALDGSWTYGFAVAADTGGAIKGNRVDLCYRTQSECIQFGRRKCRVYVL